MIPSELAALHAKAFSTTRAWTTSEFAALLSQPGTFLEARHECFALIRVVADEAELLTLATDPDHQRRGHGRAVLSAGHARASKTGAASIFLEVAEDNAAAIALYSSMGYQQIGRRARYYQRSDAPAVAALVMRCDLNIA